MLIKNSIYSSFYLTTKIITFLAGLLFSQASFAGAGFTEQGNALSKADINHFKQLTTA